MKLNLGKFRLRPIEFGNQKFARQSTMDINSTGLNGKQCQNIIGSLGQTIMSAIKPWNSRRHVLPDRRSMRENRCSKEFV